MDFCLRNATICCSLPEGASNAKIPSCRFQNCPNEIIAQIVQEMVLLGDISAIASLSSCSWYFYSILQPILYSSFTQKSQKPDALVLFLRTILHRKDLAQHVKILVARPTFYNGWQVLFSKVLQTDIIVQIRDKFKILNDTDYGDSAMTPEQWSAFLSQAKWDLVTEVLLLYLPNLQEVVIKRMIKQHHTRFLVEGILRKAMELQSIGESGDFCLSNLKKISLECTVLSFPENGLSIDTVLACVSIPSVTEFACEQLTQYNSPRRMPPLLEKWATYKGYAPSTLTSLTLKSCFLGPHKIHYILALFPHLEQLTYQSFYFLPGYTEFYCWPFSVAIAHLQNTLRELSVTLMEQHESECDGHEAEADRKEPREPLRSLASFKKLRVLEASASVLIGRDSIDDTVTPFLTVNATRTYSAELIERFLTELPPFLEHLTIINCRESIFGVLDALLASDGNVCELQSITITFKKGMSWQYALFMHQHDISEQQLKERFASRNIGFAIQF